MPAPVARTPRCRSTSLEPRSRSEEHTSELQSQFHLVCRLLLEKKTQPTKSIGKQRAGLFESTGGGCAPSARHVSTHLAHLVAVQSECGVPSVLFFFLKEGAPPEIYPFPPPGPFPV